MRQANSHRYRVRKWKSPGLLVKNVWVMYSGQAKYKIRQFTVKGINILTYEICVHWVRLIY